jgi:acyl phosphate:glycerol-3-phosphate acyltransferase
MSRPVGHFGRPYTRLAMAGLVPALGGSALGYTIGSLPFGLWMGRAVGGVDVREHGSGGTGTTNVLRTVGPVAAGAVFVLDVGKGVAAVAGARALGAGPGGQAAAGLAAVAGHSWPFLAHFRGGKSVATAFGGLLMLSPEGSACAVVGGLSALAATRMVSVGSLTAAVSATLGSGIGSAVRHATAPFVFSATATAIIVWRHRANIRRLMRGEEPRVSLRSE